MQCPQTGVILRLVAGELASSREEELRQHLSGCPSCQSAWRELRDTWQALGEWEVVPPLGRQEVIVRAASDLKPESGAGPFHGIGWLRVLRIAASLALATGLGIAAGTVVPIPGSSSGPSAQATPSDADVAESLGITELAAEPATGLGRGLVMNGAPGEEEAS